MHLQLGWNPTGWKRWRRTVVGMDVKTKTLTTLLVSVFVVAFGSLVLASPASADACNPTPRGVGYTGTCVGNGGPSPSYLGPMITGNQNSVGSVDGIPCTIKNAHRCRAHLQLGGTYVP
jgi:hypothetical protein